MKVSIVVLVRKNQFKLSISSLDRAKTSASNPLFLKLIYIKSSQQFASSKL